ncbi:glutathione S-transferase [Amylibacter ulvae]|uniref:Glutathione S-transferase n=1 Tax=Paramylibacter ulvae TaxID=1651968 RepID=A0ABQ3D9I0_9RHOB|nr:glutathione S-transferase family protein [Amylibacter ulvae]GHA62514.1 glutathione S-transferase [Amylibacter ulvae]
MKLYHNPQTIALASLIAMHETGAKFETILVDIGAAAQQSPEYLGINPKGRVPALITDNGIITETIAILGYLATMFPAAKLTPTDPYQFAKMQEFNSYLASTVHVNHAHKLRGGRWATQESSFNDMRAKIAQNMLECFQLIEREYLRGPWVMGNQYTIADPYLFAISRWLTGDGVDMNALPAITKHSAAMNERAAVKRALAV